MSFNWGRIFNTTFLEGKSSLLSAHYIKISSKSQLQKTTDIKPYLIFGGKEVNGTALV